MRKKTAIYGKSSKRPPIYDLFAFGYTESSATTLDSKTPPAITQLHVSRADRGSTLDRSTRVFSSPSEGSQPTSSPLNTVEDPILADSSALFEIASSDDETQGSVGSGPKRRKLMSAFESANSDEEASSHL